MGLGTRIQPQGLDRTSLVRGSGSGSHVGLGSGPECRSLGILGAGDMRGVRVCEREERRDSSFNRRLVQNVTSDTPV